MIRKILSSLCGLLLCAAAVAEQPGLKTQLVGGTSAGLGAKGTVRLDLADPDFLVLRNGSTELRVPYKKINTLEYGQNVSRRYAAAILISPVLLLSKSRKHYVTLGFVDAAGGQQAMVFRIGKGDIRSMLASLEARTGRRVEYQDEEARKGGKG